MSEVGASAFQCFKGYYAADNGAPISSPLATGDHLDVNWTIDNAYYPVVFKDIATIGQHVVSYEDGKSKTLDRESEAWCFCAFSMLSIPRSVSIASDVHTILY